MTTSEETADEAEETLLSFVSLVCLVPKVSKESMISRKKFDSTQGMYYARMVL